jgi:hypothetical protein
MKSDKNLIFADIVYFDLIYSSEKKRENSNRGQKMSAKICQKILYCELTLAGSSKRAPRILIFSIAMCADYSFDVKNIEI